jgi:C-terminal processing protease CtpA/Prc
LGNTALQRFKVTVNYDQQKIILEPTDWAPEDPYRWVSVGIIPDTAEGKAKVIAVTRGLSAEEQGVKVGDTIIEIDGQPVDKASEATVRFRGPAGSKVKIKVQRGDETLEFELERRSIL